MLVSAGDDADTADQALTLHHAVAHTGGSAEYDGFEAADVAVTVDDDDDPGLALSAVTDPLAVSEGAQATYTVALQTVPTGAVTVAVSSDDESAATVAPASLSFTVSSWNVAQTVTVTGVGDDDGADESVTLTHAASGADYAGVEETLAVAVDDGDEPGVTISKTLVPGTALALDEGGAAGTYTVVLDTLPSGGTVTVEVASSDTGAVTASPASLEFTRATWNVAQTVTVRALDDDDAADETVTVTHTAAHAGGAAEYDGLAVAGVAVTVDDADAPGLAVTAVTAATNADGAFTVTEGATAAYTVELHTQPSGPVTVSVTSSDTGAATVDKASLSFTADDWDTPQTVTVTGVADDDAADESVTLTHRASGADYAGVDAETLAVAVADDDPLGVTVSKSALALDERGAADTYTVVLDTPPSGGTVTVAVASSHTAVALAPASLAFTASNWDQAQTVTLSAPDDANAVDEEVTVSHAVTHAGGAREYEGLAVDDVTVTVADDDDPGVAVTAALDPDAALAVTEGATATYTVALATQPSGPVTVALTSDDEGAATAAPASLSFTVDDWNTAQTVTVTGVADDDAADESATLTHTPSGADYAGVEATRLPVAVADDDEPGVTVSKSSIALDEDPSGTNSATYTVVLDTLPSGGTVTVAVESSDAAVTVDKASLEFTASTWNTAQTVTLTAADDANATGETVTVSHTAAHAGGSAEFDALAVADVTVTVTDDDTPGLVVTAATNADGALAVAEGARAAYTVALRTQPSGAVTVSVTSSDAGAATASPASLSFTADDWDTPQSVTVTGKDDDDAGDETATLTHAASGADYGSVEAGLAVAVADDDEPGVTVSKSSIALTEDPAGTNSATYTVVLDTLPSGGTVTVAVESSDAAVTVSPASLEFTASSWSTAQTVTLTAAVDANGASERVTVSHTASHTGGSAEYAGLAVADVTVEVTDDDAPGLAVTAARNADGALAVTEGATATYTVALATQPSGAVTVAVSSSDTGAATVDKASLSFTAEDWSTAQTVTVTGVADADAADESVTLTHAGSGAGYGSVSETLAVSVDDDDTAGVTVSETSLALDEDPSGTNTASYTVVLDTLPSGGTVTVEVASGDEGAVRASPASLEFTADNWDTAQTVTVTAVADPDAMDEEVTLTHTAAHTGGSAEYDGLAVADVAVTVDDAQSPGLAVTAARNADGALAVTEGATATYTVALRTEPSGPVTVAVSSSDTGAATVDKASLGFTVDSWDTAQTVTVEGKDDDDAGDESVTLTHAASGADYASVSETLAVAVADDDEPGVTVSKSSIALTEDPSGTNSASYTVVLDTLPSGGTVTVAVESSNAAVTVDKASLEFTASTWNVAQTVTVTAADDANGASERVTVTHTASHTGGAAEYAGLAVDDVTVEVTDDDAPGLVVTAARNADGALAVAEGATATYTVALATQPNGPVTVAVSSSDTGAATVDQAALAFTAEDWSTAQTVTVTGVADADAADESVTLTHAGSGADYAGVEETLAVAVADDDSAGVTVSKSSLALDEDPAGTNTATYTVVLDTLPSGGTVTVAVASSDAAVTVSPASLSFTTTTWNQARTVTLTAADDANATDERVTVSHTASHAGGAGEYDGLAVADVTVTVTDDDTPALVVTAARNADGALAVGEGATATYTVKLRTEPSGPVTVSVTSSDTGAATATPASLGFTVDNWDVAQTVTVTGVADDDAGDEAVTLTHASSGADYGSVEAELAVAVADDDEPGVTVSKTLVPGSSIALDEDPSGTNTAAYTVVLDTLPSGGTVTVELSKDPDSPAVTVSPASLEFTASTWSTAQTVTVTAADDANATGETVTVSHTVSHSGGSAEYAGLAVAGVTVTVADDDTPALVVTAPTNADGALAVSEGATAEYTVKLATQPSGAVTVAVASSDTGAATVDKASLSFTVDNWNTAQTVTVTGVGDDDAADESVTLTHAASGADYAGVEAELAVAVGDDDEAGVTVTAVTNADGALAVTEGATASYTVVLASAPSGGTVTVRVESGDTSAVTVDKASLSFTASNWDTAQTVTLTAVEDEDASDETVTVTHTAAHAGGGGEYDGLGVDAVTVAVDDDETPGLVVDAPTNADGALAVTEGATAAYTVALRTQPSGPVTVAVSSSDTGAATAAPASLGFTVDNWDTPQTVTVTGVADDDAGDESVTLTHAASGADYGSVEAGLAVAVADDDTPGVTVSKSSIALDEDPSGTNSATWTVVLDTLPSGGTVTVELAKDPDSPAVTLSPASLEFTASSWDTAQTVTVTAADDANATDEGVTVSHSVSHTGGSAEYAGLAVAGVTVDVTDDDTPALVVTATTNADGALAVSEGATATYTVALATQPSGPVTVAVTSDDGGAATVDKASLEFTVDDWNTAQTVTVTGVADDDAADESVTLTHAASGADYAGVEETLAVAVGDDDTAGVTVSETSLALDEDPAGTNSATWTVVLDTLPSGGTVRVEVASSDAAVTVSPASLEFTTSNWNQAQTVTLTAVDDANAADETVTVSHTASHAGGSAEYDGLAVDDVTVTVTDDDTPALVVDASKNADGALALAEGATATYTVKLRTQPSGPVTVAVSSSDTGAATVDKASLGFTVDNWDVAQTVTVTAVDDDDAGDESVTLTHAASGADYGGVEETLAVAVADDDEPGVTVTGGPFALDEDPSGTNSAAYTVVLETAPSAGTVTVELAKDPDTPAVTVSPASLEFTASTWSTAQTVTLTAADDANATDERATVSHTVSHTGGSAEYAGLAVADVTVTVTDDDTPALAVTATTNADGALAVSEGSTAAYTVKLATQPSGPVTVEVASSDTGAATAAPASLAFTTDTWNVAQTVRVTAVADDDAGDEAVTLTHRTSGADYVGVEETLAVAVADDDTPGVTVSETALALDEDRSGTTTATYTVVLDTLPSGGTVTVEVASSDAAVTVSPASLGFTTSNWNTARTVTVTAVEDTNRIGERVTVSHTAAHPHGSGEYDGLAGADVTVTVTDKDAGIEPSGLEGDKVFVLPDRPGTFRVALTSRPAADVTVEVSVTGSGPYTRSDTRKGSDTAKVTVDPTSLTFTPSNWDTPQKVTVTAKVDADDAPAEVTLRLSAPGFGSVDVTVVVFDEDDELSPGPRGLAVNTGSNDCPDGAMHLYWDEPEGFAVAGYEFRYRAGGGAWKGWEDAEGGRNRGRYARVPRRDSGRSLSNGTSYEFEVRARAADGEVTRAAGVTATPSSDAPGAPTDFAAGTFDTRTGALPLTWSAPASSGGAPVTEYAVRETSDPVMLEDWPFAYEGGSLALVPPPRGDARGGDVYLLSGTGYTFEAAAVSACGVGAYSSELAKTTEGVKPPTGVTAAASGTNGVALSWTAPENAGDIPRSADSGDSEYLFYEYRWCMTSDKACRPYGRWDGWADGNATGATVEDLESGREYRFWVRSRVNGHVSSSSVSVTATPGAQTQTAAPGAPVGLAAAASGAARIALTWRAPEGDGVTGYEVEWSPDGASDWQGVSPAHEGTGTEYADSVEPGTARVYRVRARAGDVPGPWSGLASAVAAPGAPTELAASASGAGDIALSWTAPEGGGVTGYAVEWSPDGTSGWQGVSPAHEGTATSYAHTGLDAGTAYHYRVLALAGRVPGSWSAVASARTEDAEPAAKSAALSAAFTALPAQHGGAGTTFVVRLEFSAPVTASYRVLRDGAIAASNGAVRKAKRVSGSAPERAWDITVAPASNEAVTLTLAAPGAACGEAGAICSAEGVRLSGTATATVQGPAALSVADARAEEGVDATLDFAVTLERAAPVEVRVDYASADGTATAGADYTAVSGTLVFAAGETGKTVRVAVLDDALDEGEETMRLALTNVSGAWLADGQATGTIVNSDRLMTMWHARFGRTVAGQVTEAVAERLSGPAPGSQVTLGGERLPLFGGAGGAEDGSPGLQAGAEDIPLPVAKPGGAAGLEAHSERLGGGDGNAERDRALTGRELMLGSSFHLSSGGGEAGGPALSAWGRVTADGFDGEEAGGARTTSVDGEVVTGIVGVDTAGEDWLAGIAVSVSEGEGRFGETGGVSGALEGTVESTMTAVHPYVRVDVNERVSAWGLAGYGEGRTTVVEAAREMDGEAVAEVRTRTDVSMVLGAMGVRGVILEAAEDGGLDLALKGDAFVVETEWDAVSNEDGTRAGASRVRLALEGSRAFETGGGGVLTPGLEVGLRHDGGDAETGTGVELGGSLEYRDPATGLGVEARARGLVAHEAADYEEWGASASVRLEPGADGRGLSIGVSPSWGNASGGVDGLWSAEDARGLAPEGAFEAQGRLEAELGYGLAAGRGGWLTGTPYAGVALGEDAREWRLGYRLRAVRRESFDFELDLGGKRREPANDDEPGHEVTLRLIARW